MIVLAQLAAALAGPPADPAPRIVPPVSGAPGGRPAFVSPAAVSPAVGSGGPAPAPDRWLGADKLRHLALAGLAESVAFGGARVAGAGRRGALVVGIGVGAAVSVGKELVDRRRGGRASVRDLVWDAAGLALYGAALARTAR